MGPVVRTANVIADRELQTLLQNGFPANLHYRTELWSRGGLFDDVKSSVEWDVLVRYEPLTKTYRVARFVGRDAENLGRFERYEDAQAVLARPYQPKLPARRTRDRQYYIVTLEVEVLSMSDLDEIDRWLRGPLRNWARERLEDQSLYQRFPLDRRRVLELLDLHLSEKRDTHPLLWAVLMLAPFA